MRTTGMPSGGPDSQTCMPRRPVSTRKERIARDYPAMTRVVLSMPTLADEDEFLAANLASQAYHRPFAYNPMTASDYHASFGSLGERKHGCLARHRADGGLVG